MKPAGAFNRQGAANGDTTAPQEGLVTKTQVVQFLLRVTHQHVGIIDVATLCEKSISLSNIPTGSRKETGIMAPCM